MGRDEHRQTRGNKARLPQTPKYEKGTNGVDIEMSNNPEVQFGVNEDRNNKQK